jgi:outer membrane murein-binding lipoprotein Lpp
MRSNEPLYVRVNQVAGIITLLLALIGGGFYFGQDRTKIDKLEISVSKLENKVETLNQNLIRHMEKK